MNNSKTNAEFNKQSKIDKSIDEILQEEQDAQKELLLQPEDKDKEDDNDKLELTFDMPGPLGDLVKTQHANKRYKDLWVKHRQEDQVKQTDNKSTDEQQHIQEPSSEVPEGSFAQYIDRLAKGETREREDNSKGISKTFMDRVNDMADGIEPDDDYDLGREL